MDAKTTIEALASGRLSFDAFADSLKERKLLNLAIDVGRTCSLTCAGMCYRTDRKQPTRENEYVAMDVLVREVDIAAKRGLLSLSIAGTEPFLHLDNDPESSRLAVGRTFDILEQLGNKSRSYRVGLISNGLDIHRHWDTLTAMSRRGNVDYMDLSIDSGDPEEHDRIRGRKGAGEAAIAALQEANRRLHGMYLSTSSVLRSTNAQGILRLVREQAGHNSHFFVTPIQPLGQTKGVRPISAQALIAFVREMDALLWTWGLTWKGVDVTILTTGFYAYDLIQAGLFSMEEARETETGLAVSRYMRGNALHLEVSVLPAYGSHRGLLEFTGDYLPHAHALELPRESRGTWVAGNVRDTSLQELHARGQRGIIRDLVLARKDHSCRNEPCWNTCFGGMAFNMESAALGGRPLTERPAACIRPGVRLLPILTGDNSPSP